MRGDTYYAKGDKAAALNEYRSAQGSASAGNTPLLDLKIADLAAVAPASARARRRGRSGEVSTMRQPQRWAGLAAVLLLVACSKDKAIDQPAKLTPFAATLRVQRLWGASVDDKKAADLRLGLGIAIDKNRVYAAGHKGDVVAFDLNKGRVQWRTRLKAPLSGGTSAAGDLLLIGSSDGRLFALNALDGKLRWNVRINGEVLAPPAISERLIALRTGDGKLRGLSPVDGHELWSTEQQVPRLSLRGTSRPVIVGSVVICGFDNGKVVAVSGSDGSVQWEQTVTPPHGRTELERLSTSMRPCWWPDRMCTRWVFRGGWRCWRWIPVRAGGRTNCRAIAA